MSKDEESILSWWVGHRTNEGNAKSRYGSFDLDIIRFAMRDFAKQEAIGFAEWVGECDYEKTQSYLYIERNPHGIKSGYYTKDQLYNLYQQQKEGK